jgi:surface carbohydrate biosynthesis protein
MQNKINLLFPIEIMNRELDFRLFLAAYCARPNNRIFIGQTDAIYRVIQHSQGGLYVGKNIRPPRRRGQGTVMEERYTTLKQRGVKLLNLDEEGGIMAGDEARWQQWLNTRLDVCALDADDHVCTWGDWQKNYYTSLNPPCKENIQTTGHPRFDLYKAAHRDFYRDDVEKLQNKYGDFVIVNTNFALSNNRSGLKAAFSSRFFYDDPRNAVKRMDHVSHWSHIWHITVNFVQLITRLSIEMPQLNYIIRPHPSENAQFYKTIFAGVDNVQVVHEGSVGPWLLASKALIHDGCTTALEAHFCDVPIINYKSVQDKRYDLMLPNLFGTQCTSEDEVVCAMQRVLKGEVRPDASQGAPDAAVRLLDNFQHDSFTQLRDRIARVADALPPEKSELSWKFGAATATGRLRDRFSRQRKPKTYTEGSMMKWQGLNSVDLDRKMQSVQQILNKEVRYTVQTSRIMTVEC